MIKDRKVVLKMNLLQLKFKNKNLFVKMSTFVFISIKHVSERFFFCFFFFENPVNTDTWYVLLVSVSLGFHLCTVVVMVVTTWGRGRTRASGNGSGRCSGNGSGSGSVDGGCSVSGGAWW